MGLFRVYGPLNAPTESFCSPVCHVLWTYVFQLYSAVIFVFARRLHENYDHTGNINTFAASYLNAQGLNNSCLKSPASTLVDLTFQWRALRSFSLNELRNLSIRRETYTAASVYLADIIFIPFIVQYAYIAI